MRSRHNLGEFLADFLLQIRGDKHPDPLGAAFGERSDFGGWFGGNGAGAGGAGMGGLLVAVGCFGDGGFSDGDGDDVGVGGCGNGGAQGQEEGKPLGFGEHGGWWSGEKWWWGCWVDCRMR